MKSFRKSNTAVQTRLGVKSFILLVVSLLAISCSNMLGSQGEASSARGGETGSVGFTGTISVTGALPVDLSHAELDSASQSSASRSALPSFTIDSGYYYYVTATKTDGSDSFNINSIDDAGSFDRANGVTFALELGIGNWNIECGLKKAKTSGAASDDDLPVMSDTYPAPLTSANPVVNHTFYPKPSQSGEGKVELKISVHTGVSVDRVTASCSKSAWAEKVSGPAYDGNIGQWIIKTNPSDTLPSGTYEVTFNFYNTSNILLYSTVQTINVFDNMTTNTWLSDGSGVIDDEGTFALSVSLVSSFARTTFYVGQTSAATSVKVTASDITGTGSPYAPFASVTKAAEVIAATGESSKDYRIYVSGTVTGAQEISGAVNDKANSITIQGYNGLDSNGEPKDALSCSGLTNAVTLEVLSTVPVTLKNIKLLGDSTPTSKTMVLVLENGYETDVTIEEGVWITGNDTSSFTEETFSAVYVGVDGKLTMKGGKISGNKCMSGGGIVVGGTFVMTGGEISGNEATAFGGGVYNVGSMFMYGSAVIGDSSKTSAATESDYSNKAGSKGAGIYSLGNLYLGYSDADTETELTGGVFYNFSHDTGGIYQYANKTFLMNSGFVSYNAGRGIYVGNCSFTMSGGSVSGNTTFEPGNDYQTNGAGIYAGYASTVLISGGTISGNEAGEDGGGLYIAKSNTSVTISGGTISSNTVGVNGNGNGIAIAYGSLKMKGNASVDSNNDVYLASGKVITVTGELTGTTPIATITPAAWSRGTTVVQADGTNLTTLKGDDYDYTNYFAISDEDWKTKPSTDNKSLIIDAPIYVAGTDITVCGEAGNDTSGKGTKAKPFATIEKAVSVMDDSTADYTIYIDGTVTGAQTIPVTLKKSDSGTYKAQSVTIEGVNGLNENGEPKDSLNGTSENSVTRPLNINSEVPVTITKLKITGGNIGGNGGGIYIDTGTNVSLGDGVLVTGNKAASGGGIYNRGKLYLYGSAMVGKETDTVATSISKGNTATVSGAGIYVDSTGSLYLGYKSEEEKSDLTGGVCGNYNANTNASEANGGGIYNAGAVNFKIASGNISYNYCINSAGIYTEGNLTMSGGIIKGNEGNENGIGGGVYIHGDSKTFTMSGNAQIINNKNTQQGGGVLLYYKNCSFIMKGGTISGNIAKFGGAVFMPDNTEDEHSYMEISGDANIPYGAKNEQDEFVKAAGMNDIYMYDTHVRVKITGSLSADGADNVIGITPNSYTEGTPLLAAEDGVNLANEVGKFRVAPDAANPDIPWRINAEGKLFTDFVKVTGVTITGNETWNPSSSVFVNERNLTIPDLIVCDHEVTRGEFNTLMGTDPSNANAYDKEENKLTGDAVLNTPVNKVSWYAAIAYCNKLSIIEGLDCAYTVSEITDWANLAYSEIPTSDNDTWNAATCNFEANGYRLPTEAEWEWLARGGQNYTYAGSDTIDDVAWYYEGIPAGKNGTREVKTKDSNGYGLYDMSGNVCEWCWDWYNGSISSSTGASGVSSGDDRVSRGGGWSHDESYCGVGDRSHYSPDWNNNYFGFRVVRNAQ